MYMHRLYWNLFLYVILFISNSLKLNQLAWFFFIFGERLQDTEKQGAEADWIQKTWNMVVQILPIPILATEDQLIKELINQG